MQEMRLSRNDDVEPKKEIKHQRKKKKKKEAINKQTSL